VWWDVHKEKKRVKQAHPDWNDEQCEIELKNENKGSVVSEAERQAALSTYVVGQDVCGIFNAYNTVAIGFGYLILFSAAFPLAPFVLLITDMLDCSSVGWELLAATRKPEYYGARDIGRYLTVFKFLVFISVITNIGLVTFTSAQFTSLFVSESNVTIVQRFTIAILTEHIVFLVLYAIYNSFNDNDSGLRQDLAYDAEIKDISAEYDEWVTQRKEAQENGDPVTQPGEHNTFEAHAEDIDFEQYDEKLAAKEQQLNEKARDGTADNDPATTGAPAVQKMPSNAYGDPSAGGDPASDGDPTM